MSRDLAGQEKEGGLSRRIQCQRMRGTEGNEWQLQLDMLGTWAVVGDGSARRGWVTWQRAACPLSSGSAHSRDKSERVGKEASECMVMLLTEKAEAEEPGLGNWSVLLNMLSLANTSLEYKPMRAEICTVFPDVSQASYIVAAWEGIYLNAGNSSEDGQSITIIYTGLELRNREEDHLNHGKWISRSRESIRVEKKRPVWERVAGNPGECAPWRWSEGKPMVQAHRRL